MRRRGQQRDRHLSRVRSRREACSSSASSPAAAGSRADNTERRSSPGRRGCFTARGPSCSRTRTARILEPHSVSAGLDYPGVGPEHACLRRAGRARYVAVTDDEALDAFERLSELEGHHPRLRALARARFLAEGRSRRASSPARSRVLVNLCGRGDKDLDTYFAHYAARRGRDDVREPLLAKRSLAKGPQVSPFLVLGDPTPELSVELARAAVDAGAGMLEIGFPYGDPVADGPAIQAADVRALAGGTSTTQALEILRPRTRGLSEDARSIFSSTGTSSTRVASSASAKRWSMREPRRSSSPTSVSRRALL